MSPFDAWSSCVDFAEHCLARSNNVLRKQSYILAKLWKRLLSTAGLQVAPQGKFWFLSSPFQR